jgi:hypothetical protein
MTEKEPEGVAPGATEREYLHYDADIDTLKNFMQKLGDKESLDKFFIQQGVISLYKQLREEITPPREIENAWHRILITDSYYENPSDYKSSCDDNPDYFE